MDAVIFRKASGLSRVKLAFRLQRANLARQISFCIASRNSSLMSCAFSFCRLSRPLGQRHKITMQMGRCLVHDHCGNDILLRHTFPLALVSLFFSTPDYFFAFLGDIAPKLYRCFHHLDCVFPNLSSCIQLPTAIHLASPYVQYLSVSERYCLSFAGQVILFGQMLTEFTCCASATR